jgi:hypothetical protein|tara:strand:- start:5589 stop:5999 length:411 start_codon:yes stop_codon:yes gene_type:complete
VTELDIKDKLAAWGAWSRSDSSGLGYISPCLLIMRGNVAETCRAPRAHYISDDEAMLIDAAIKMLRQDYEVLFQIVRRKYYRCWTAKEIAQHYLTDIEYPRLAHLDWEHKDKKRSDHRHVGLMLKEAERMIEQYLA